MKETILMKGNEAIAEGAIRCGADAYFGYPITPQSEVLEYLMERDPERETGMVVLQAESEIASINMVLGAAACGKKVITSSSSPGISLMLEGISYIAGSEVPCVIANIVRGGPGLGTIQPAQSDYFQSTKGGGHGDYHCIVLAPASVQEMYDFVSVAFWLSFKYRVPAMILSDGVIGQMMEKVEVGDFTPRMTDEYIAENLTWAATGNTGKKPRSIITSLNLDPDLQEKRLMRLNKKYIEIVKTEQKYETFNCDDADYLLVAYGSSARICQKTMQLAREKGIKVGLFRPITLYPFPSDGLYKISQQMKGILSVEMSLGQLIEDVKLAVQCKVPVEHYGRCGGIIHTPEEILEALVRMVK